MTLSEQVLTQALLMSQQAAEEDSAVLEVLCRAAVSSLTRQLRTGLTPEDCKADFVAAASLFALSALSVADDKSAVEMFQAGDLSIRRRGGDAASNCLRNQAELMIAPYLKDRFSFMGV